MGKEMGVYATDFMYLEEAENHVLQWHKERTDFCCTPSLLEATEG